MSECESVEIQASNSGDQVSVTASQTVEAVEITATDAGDQVSLSVSEGGEAVSVSVTEGPQRVVVLAGNGLAGLVHEVLSGTQNGINKIFTTSYQIDPGSERVYVNGVPSPNYYTVTGENEITVDTPPKTWWVLEIRYRRAQ